MYAEPALKTTEASPFQRWMGRSWARWRRRSHPLVVDAASLDHKLAALLYHKGLEALIVTDAQNRIVSVNPAFTRITGYSEAEVLGESVKLLRSPFQEPATYQDMRGRLSQQGKWEGEIWSKRKNDESFPSWVSVSSLYDPQGQLQRRVTLLSDITHKKASENLVWRQANFDPLTQLPNRNMLKDRLTQAIKKATTGQQLALLSVHLDNFAALGEQADGEWSDRLLLESAKRIARIARDADTVARTGIDSFAIVLTDLDEIGQSGLFAQRVLHELAQPFELDAALVALSASIGIAVYPGEAESGDALLQHAQHAMVVARQLGGNQFRYSTPALQRDMQQRTQTAKELRQAVKEQQFLLHFQPIVSLATGGIHKAEALVRWQHPQRGLVGPGEFIALAEETHLIGEIGDWVFKEAARWTKQWRQVHCPGFQVSVNKSPAQFGRGNHCGSRWTDYLREIGLPGDAVSVEITESLVLNATAAVTSCLSRFREAGMQVSLDDFGTGYASISYLKKLDLDCIKIDRSYVANLAPGSHDLALCEAIVVMAHKLGLQVVAEGIETEQQRELLTAIGCDLGQGYLFSPPVPPQAFEQLLARS